MARTINVAGVGEVQVPDSATDAEIVAFARNVQAAGSVKAAYDKAIAERPGAIMSGIYGAAGSGVRSLAGALDGNYDPLANYLYDTSEYLGQKSDQYVPDVPSYRDIGSVSDALKYAGAMTGQAIPYMAAPVIGGVVGGLLGGPPGALAGASAVSFPLMMGDNMREQQQDKSISARETNAGIAALTAVPQTALDVIGLEGAGKLISMFRRAGREAQKEIAKEAVKRLTTKDFAAQIGKSAGSEALTESAQQALQIAQANPDRLREMDDQTIDELLNAAIGGAILGGGLGGGMEAISKNAENRAEVAVQDRQKAIESLRNQVKTEADQGAVLNQNSEVNLGIDALKASGASPNLTIRQTRKAVDNNGVKEKRDIYTISDAAGTGQIMLGEFSSEDNAKRAIEGYHSLIGYTPNITKAAKAAPKTQNGQQATPPVAPTISPVQPPIAGAAPSTPNTPQTPATGLPKASDIPVPESPQTLEIQRRAVESGKRAAILYLPEDTVPPKVGKGMGRVKLSDGRTIDFNKKSFTAKQVREAAANDRLNEVLQLGPFNKDEVQASAEAGNPVIAVTERTTDGTEVKAAVGTTETAPEQVAALEATKTAPENTVAVEPAENVIADRIAQKPIIKKPVPAPVVLASRPELATAVANAAQKRLSALGLKGVSLKIQTAVKSGEFGRYASGAYDPVSKTIEISLSAVDPAASEREFVRKLSEIVDHEAIHAIVDLGVITKAEFATLLNVAGTTKYPGTKFSYIDRAAATYGSILKNPDGTIDRMAVGEEAVAEMFRDWNAGRLRAQEKPAGLFNRIREFFRRLRGAAKEAGFNKIFADLNAGQREPVVTNAGQGAKKFSTTGVTDEQRSEQAGDRGGRDRSGSLAPLPGAPTVEGASGPDPVLNSVAEQYARDAGIDYKRQPEYVSVNEDRARRLAKAYEDMPHAPGDPAVREAYQNLIKQTLAQYRALENAGYRFYLFDENTDPYAGNPWNAMRDLRKNKRMGVFSTEAGFGSGDTDLNVEDNPLLEDTGLVWPFGENGPPKKVFANDLFRAVHDAFGHGLEGAGFRAQGEENAWQAHARLFTGSALAALTTETRGQNSWLNYGPRGEKNRTAKLEDTTFADQKTGLLPEWAWTEGLSTKSDGKKFSIPADDQVFSGSLDLYHGFNPPDEAIKAASELNESDLASIKKEATTHYERSIESLRASIAETLANKPNANVSWDREFLAEYEKIINKLKTLSLGDLRSGNTGPIPSVWLRRLKPEWKKTFSQNGAPDWRYDGNVFGDGAVYLDGDGKWIANTVNQMTFNHAIKVAAKFDKALVITPENAKPLFAKVAQRYGVKSRDVNPRVQTEDMTKYAHDNGYDGIVVSGFDNLLDSVGGDEDAMNRLDEEYGAYLSYFQDQVAAFYPEKLTAGDRVLTGYSAPKGTVAEQIKRKFSIPARYTGESEEEFRKWLGGSEANGESVKNGVPVKFYTGTSKDVDFKSFKAGERGIWLTTNPAEASGYALENDSMRYRPAPTHENPWRSEKINTRSRVIPLYARMENTLDLSGDGAREDFARSHGIPFSENYGRYEAAITRAAKQYKFDSIKWANGIYSVFSPTQVKSQFNEFAPGAADSRKFAIAPQMSNSILDRDSTSFGLFPYLRSKSPKYFPIKPRQILAGTKPRNAQQQIASLDDLLSRHKNTLASESAFAKYLADALGKAASRETGVPLVPYNAVKIANDPSIIASQLRSLTPGQLAQARDGLREALRLKSAYQNGSAGIEHTGKLLLWGILSRGVSPFVQESLFLDAVKGRGNIAGIGGFVEAAARGEFNIDEYNDWLSMIIPEGSTGAGAKHNLGAFGKTTLTKLQQRLPNGQTAFERLHELISDYSLSGKDVRREFHKINDGIGINNKVISFMLLISGRDDVLVLDRVQMRNQFDDGRFAGYNLYDGEKIRNIKDDGTEGAAQTVTGTAISDLGNGILGLAYYEALERDLLKSIRAAYASVGRASEASLGRYHWESWVASSAQEVDHGTITGIINDANGTADPYGMVTTGEGKYDTFMSGAKYGYTQNGEAYVALPDGLGNYYVFPPAEAKLVVKGYKKKSTKIIDNPDAFKVSESRERAWYERPEIDKQALKRYLESEIERRRNPEQPVRDSGEDNADVYRPRVGRNGRAGARQVDAAAIADKYFPVKQEVSELKGKAENIAKKAAQPGADIDALATEADNTVRKAVRKLSVPPQSAPMPADLELANETIFSAKHTPTGAGERLMEMMGGVRTKSGRMNLMERFRVSFVQREAQIGKYENQAYANDKLLSYERNFAEYSAVASLDMENRASHYTVEIMRNGAPVIMGIKNGQTDTLANGADPDSMYMAVGNDPNNSPAGIFEILYTGGPGGTSLVDHFRTYAVAQVSKRRISEGKEVPAGVTPQYIAAADQLAQTYPVIADAYQRYQTFNYKLMTAVKESGYISEKLFNHLTDDMNYYSMYREIEEADVPTASGGVAKQIRFREYRGSTQGNLMADPIVAMMHNVAFWNAAILKTIASRKSLRVGEATGVVRRLGPGEEPAAGEDPRVMFTRINGEEVRFATTDPLFATGLGTNDFSSIGWALEIMGLPASFLREMVTRDPGFMLANLLRDSVSTWVLSGSQASPAGTFTGFKKALLKNSSFEALRRFGVVGSFDEAQKSPTQFVEKLRRDITSANKNNVGGVVRKAWDALEKVSEASDAATRIAVYEAAIAAGESEFTAAYRALSIMNFSRSGSSAGLRILTRLIPFLGARIQGFDVLYQGVKAGVKTAIGAEQSAFDRQRGTAMLYRAAALTAASLALALLNEDDDDYKQLPQYIKDSNLVIPIGGGKFLTVPKPFEAGFLFMTVPTTAYEMASGDRSTRSAMQLFSNQFSSTFGFNPMPQFALPLYENYMNRDFYTGQPLISIGAEKLDPSLQYNASTSYVARGLGAMLKYTPFGYNTTSGKFESVSPILIDNLITGYGGPLASYLSMALGGMSYAFGSDNQGLPVSGSSIPVMRRFFVDAKDKQPQASTEAYEVYQLVDRANRTMSRLRRSGDAEAMKQYRQDNADLLRLGKQVTKMAENLNNIRAQVRRLEADKVMSFSAKAERMRGLRAREAQLTRRIDQINKKLGR